MKTVAILSGKGGSGKSTIALHLAVAGERRGHSVAVLDIDPQASSATWADTRESETPSVTSLQPSRIAKALETAKEAGASLAMRIVPTPP